MADGEDFPCGLISSSPDGTLLAVNDTLLAWTGFKRAALLGTRRLDELFTLPSRIYYETHLAPLLRMQGFVSQLALDVARADGTTFPIFLNSVEERDAAGEVVCVRTALFDATERHRYERELVLARRTAEEAVRAKLDFLAMFAHEIRNPLGAVMLQVETLHQLTKEEPQLQRVGRLRSSVAKVIDLLNDMLDVSKLEAGKVVLENVPFDLRDLAQAVVQSVSPFAEKKSLLLEVELGPDLPLRVLGDPVKLDQVLSNLLGNAVKFTERGAVTLSIVQVSEQKTSSTLRFSVRDTGIGISPTRQMHVFERYEQADASIARRFGGTGLGLAIARQLVRLQGGELALVSRPAEGSTFSFELTLTKARREQTPARPAP